MTVSPVLSHLKQNSLQLHSQKSPDPLLDPLFCDDIIHLIYILVCGVYMTIFAFFFHFQQKKIDLILFTSFDKKKLKQPHHSTPYNSRITNLPTKISIPTQPCTREENPRIFAQFSSPLKISTPNSIF